MKFTNDELEALKNGEVMCFDCCTFEELEESGEITEAYVYNIKNGDFGSQTYYIEAYVPALGIKGKFISYN